MKQKRYSEEQIVKILGEQSAGVQASEIIRRYGISEGTFYRWKSKYAGMEVQEVKRLRQLEEENRKLKQLVAEKELDIQGLKAALEGKY
jgi:putative transposase